MAVRIASMEHHHQEPPPPPPACPPAPTWLPVRRTLHERRALRRALYLAVARRPGMASSSSCSASTINPSLVAELQLESLARRRAFVAAAHKFAATAAAAAEFSKQQQQQQQQQQQRQQQQQQQQQQQRTSLLVASVVIATPPPPPTAAPSIIIADLPRPSATAAVRNSKINPEVYFLNLLEQRGRVVTKKMSSQEAGYVKQPTAKQVLDYQSQPFMSDLVRKGDLDGLRAAVAAGRGMDASNKFGESLVHIACRRGHMDVLLFLLANGGTLACCDDIGRFPLHEVCWAVRPRFDIVRLFLEGKRRPTDDMDTNTDNSNDNNASNSSNTDNNDNNNDTNTSSTSNNNNNNNDNSSTTSASSSTSDSNSNSGASSTTSGDLDELNPLLITDKRGCTPLRYVKEESWPMWRHFLDEVVDEYWPSLI